VAERPDIPKWTAAAPRDVVASRTTRGSDTDERERFAMAARMPKTQPVLQHSATIIAFPTRPWWATAPNPVCLDWCEVDHDPAEFASSASFVCEQVVADDDRFLVLARSTVRAGVDDGKLRSRSSAPFVGLRLHEPTEQDMRDLLAAHTRASAVCAHPAVGAEAPRSGEVG
jgi:hypothetical protein